MSAASRIRVLLVDDSPTFRATLVGWAATHDDLEVVGAFGSAEEALPAVWGERPDIVVTDLALPGMSGTDAIRALRGVGATLPIVVLTLHDTLAARSEAASAGANAFLTKRAVADRLHALLHELACPSSGTSPCLAADHDQRIAVAAVVSAAMTHEINNALAVAQSGLAFLEENVGPDPRSLARWDEIREAIDETRIAIHHIAGVVSDVQLVLRGERRITLVEPRVAVERALRLARPRAGIVELRADLEDVPRVWASAAAITQIVLNLVLNAIAACRSWKRAGHVRVVLHQVGTAIEIGVHDDGPGIEQGMLDQLWQPLRASQAGSGLGLPVTRRLVAVLGGTIEVESRATRGTTFRVALPIPPSS